MLVYRCRYRVDDGWDDVLGTAGLERRKARAETRVTCGAKSSTNPFPVKVKWANDDDTDQTHRSQHHVCNLNNERF
jgi:hypothetical protein